MISFLNFSTKQLQETTGFQRKIKKVASSMGISELLYTEVINIETSSIDVLMIDEKMYFHKVHLYSEQAVKMLNSEFSRIVSSLGLSSEEALNSPEIIESFNLIDEIQSIFSKSMELLNVENSYNLDKLEHVASSEFSISIENFTYQEIHQIMEQLVRTCTPSLYSFKLINLSNTSVEVLAITIECKLYQYTIHFDGDYSRFINRYLSAIIPYDQFMEMKKNLKDFDFSTALYKSINKSWDISDFLSFLLTKYKSKIEQKGFGGQGLKNVYDFFLETAVDEEDAKTMIRHHFTQVATYDKKKK